MLRSSLANLLSSLAAAFGRWAETLRTGGPGEER